MILLGILEIRWKVDGEVCGLGLCVDYVVKGYSGQDHVQVSSVIHLYFDTVQYRHTAAKQVIIQSDNASSFALQELFRFIFNMDTRLDNLFFVHMDIHRIKYSKDRVEYSPFIYQ